MQVPGIRGQAFPTHLLDASGSVTDTAAPQLVLAERRVCSYLQLQNISAGNIWFEFGSARATASLTSGVVTSCSITNAGFGFTIPPIVEFLGGGANSTSVGCGLPNYPSPFTQATGRAVLTADVVTSIVIDNGGGPYVAAPFVLLRNAPNDPFGCANPRLNSGTGVLLLPGGSETYENSTAITDAIAVWGATAARWTCKWLSS